MRSKPAVTLTLLLVTVALGAADVRTGGARTAGGNAGLRRAVLKLDAAADRTTPLAPAHYPGPATANGVGPGTHLLITLADRPGDLYGCTANFVWKSGPNSFLGAAGHCFMPDNKTSTHGAGANYDRTRTTVRACVSSCLFGGQTGFAIQGNTVALGEVLYARSTLGGVDLGNDFGLVWIPTNVSVRTSMPVWGGPTGSGTVTAGSTLCMYGSGTGVGEAYPTMGRLGVGSGSTSSYWVSFMPGMVGDSGAGVQTCGLHPTATDGFHGKAAVGILTHITYGGGNISGTTMSRAIAMTSADRGITITPQMGT